MAKKTLNAENLEKLGADRLAALVMDLVQGSAALQRRARMELSAAQGPKEIAADLRKRFALLRRSTSYVDWRKQKAFVKDLTGLVGMIETGIAQQDADEAFDLLWSFLQLAPSIHARTDDSNGAVGDVMRNAVEFLATISAKLTIKPTLLAERIRDAVADAGYGEFDGIVPALAEALGAEGLAHLKQITEAWASAAPTPQEISQFRQFGLSTSPLDRARRQRQSTASIILADIADLQGDVDAYMARYSAEQMTYGTIAPDVARRLIDAGRLDEALVIIQRSRAAEDGKSFRASRYELDEVYEDCLQKMGKLDELKAHLWATFQQTLYAGSLRKYLKMLPDFEDMEAEEQALSHAETHPHLGAAIHFLLAWPDLRRLAKLVIARANDLDGNSYETLTAAADALEPDYPSCRNSAAPRHDHRHARRQQNQTLPPCRPPPSGMPDLRCRGGGVRQVTRPRPVPCGFEAEAPAQVWLLGTGGRVKSAQSCQSEEAALQLSGSRHSLGLRRENVGRIEFLFSETPFRAARDSR